MKTNQYISVIVPCLNEEGNILILYRQLVLFLDNNYDYEIIWIDDGSTDNTSKLIKEISSNNEKCRYIIFSRNFGHQIAIKAGFEVAKGNIILSIDADLQHPVSLIPEMIKKWEVGYDVINAIKEEDNELPYFKRISAKLFYNIFNKIADTYIEPGAGDFRLMDRKVVNAINLMNETNPFIRGAVAWLGFKQVTINYKMNKRNDGLSRYTYRKMANFAINGITSFGISPLRISFLIGIICSTFSFLYGIYAIAFYVFTKSNTPGWTSIIASILFFSGIQLIMLGIIGEYTGKIFLETKHRPNYVVIESNINHR